MSSRPVRASSLAPILAPAAAALLALSACGGGGSPPPAVNLTASTDTGNGTRHFSATRGGTADATLQWDFGDGAHATGASVDHAYARGGDYTVTVRAADGGSATGPVAVRFADRLAGHTCAPAAPWCWQGETALPGAGRTAWFLDALHGWVFGEEGTGAIAATTDGGMTWTAQQASSWHQLFSIRFADAQLGYATSGQGEMLRTTDGGAHWSTLATPVPASMYGPTAGIVSATAARVVLDDGYASADGGTTWTALAIGAVSEVPFDTDCWYFGARVLRQAGCTGTTSQDVTPAGWSASWLLDPVRAFSTTQRALVLLSPYAGSGPQPPVMGWETTDAGATWQSFSPQGLDGVAVAQLVMADATHGWVSTGTGTVARTQDAGRTWTPVTLPADVVAQVDPATAIGRLPDGSSWVARGARAARTSDDGATWQVLALPATPSAVGARVHAWSSDGTQVAVTLDARGFSTRDGGATWTRTYGAAPAFSYGNDIAAVALDARHAVVVSNFGAQRRTTDGLAWADEPLPGSPSSHPVSLAFTSSGTGWMMRDRRLWTTTDGAATWSEASTPGPLAAVVAAGFPDAMNGWVLDDTGLFRSGDGGVHWQSVGVPSGTHHWMSGAFPSTSTAVLLDDAGAVWVSPDGGLTWSAGAYVVAPKLKVTADGSLWAFGSGGLYRSVDGGMTWQGVRADLFNVRDVAFVDAQHGWVLDLDGTVSTTTDGGATWVDDTLGEWVLAPVAIAMSDAYTGWVVTSFGDLLGTATGGR